MYFPDVREYEDSGWSLQDPTGWTGTTAGAGKQYEWQLLFGYQWFQIDNDHVIETHYCHPGATGIAINTSQGQVFIDFEKMQTRGAAVRVQRLGLLPHGQSENMGWYFRDDQLWCEYGSQSSSRLTSSISSKDIEQHYALNPRGSLRFTVGSTGYCIDFSTMTQTNMVTGLRRNLRRRPKFNSAGLPSITAAAPQLSEGGFKWEFMGDEGQWTEYEAHICSFDSAAIESQYQLNHQGSLQFSINRFSYTLDFSRMCQINNNIGSTRTVRRTLQIQQTSSPSRWQFHDIGGVWKDYSKGNRQCSISSQDIDLQYQQNPLGTMMFTTKNFNYELDFSTMTQRNLSTNTVRSVRRL